MHKSGPSLVPIQQVERAMGITKKTRYQWESMYGFPLPERQATDERLYLPNDNLRLWNIKSLVVNNVHRPGKAVQLAREELKKCQINRTRDDLSISVRQLVIHASARVQVGDVTALMMHGRTLVAPNSPQSIESKENSAIGHPGPIPTYLGANAEQAP